MKFLSIKEQCSCGATFDASGHDGITGVGYEAQKWRTQHRCADRAQNLTTITTEGSE